MHPVVRLVMSTFSTPSGAERSATPTTPSISPNSSTGELTGWPKEWQQLLQKGGISRSEEEKNPRTIVKVYQRGHGDVWDKMGAVEAEIKAPSPILACTMCDFMFFKRVLLISFPLAQRGPSPQEIDAISHRPTASAPPHRPQLLPPRSSPCPCRCAAFP